MQHVRLKMLVTIVDRGKGASVASLYRARHLHFDYLCMGYGTANSVILDYFGLSETEKDVVITLVPDYRVGRVMRLADEKFAFRNPGRGIMFTVPLSGASSQMTRLACKAEEPDTSENGEENCVETSSKYSLILAVVNHGCVDTVMDAARAAGARGGTVIHARRAGMDDVEGLLGFTLQPEKDMVAILAQEGQKKELMVAINKAAGLLTEARGILFSLPVDELVGLQPPVEAPGAE